MKKKIKFKSLLRDFFITCLCLGISAYSIMLFYKDLNSSSIRNDKTSIATISFKHNIAQRKFNDRVVWERISQNSPLYNEDIIRTSDFAQATIHFNDGTSLDLFENTMLQIYYTEEGVRLSVGGGDVQVDAGSDSKNVALTLSDGSTVNVGAGSSVAAKSDSGSGVHNVEVKSGNAELTTETGATATLALGESVNIEKGSEIKRNPVTVIYPGSETRLLNFSGNKQNVRFKWKVSSNDSTEKLPVVIQTSKLKDFSKIDGEKLVKDSEVSEVAFVPGTTFWRVFEKENEAQASSGKINIEYIPPIELVAPAKGFEARYRTAFPRIQFKWNGNNFSDYYKLVISRTADMKDVVMELNSEDNFIAVDSLSEGKYYWKVKPYYSLNNTGFSESRDIFSFTIIKNEKIKPPELSAPADGSVISWKEKIPLNFIWKSEIPAESYELLVSKYLNFSEIAFSKKVSEARSLNELLPEEITDGTYYWKVVRRSSEPDDIQNESGIRSFSIARYIPEPNKLLYPPENFNIEKSKVESINFMWKLSKEAGTENSILQISSKNDFSVLNQEVNAAGNEKRGISLSEGTYWWRVGYKSDSGDNFTSPRKIVVLDVLQKPVLLKPESSETVLAAKDVPVKFTWNKVTGADYYDLKVLNSENNVVVQKNVKKSNAENIFAEAELLPGTYTCRLQAVCNETENSALRLSGVSESSFSVRSPSPVLLVSPSDDTRISGLSALRTPILFSWKNGLDSGKNYEFILQKLQDNGNYKTVETHSQGQKTSLSLSRLTSGTYRWEIRAASDSGISLDSGYKSFRISEIPELSAALLTSPVSNKIIDSSYLSKNRMILFSWNPVQGATSYNFVLYKKESGGKLKEIYSVKKTKDTQVIFKNLSALDIGDFVWNVSAFSYAKDGYLEQSGKTSSSNFKIQFELPKEVETLTPGRMYGE